MAGEFAKSIARLEKELEASVVVVMNHWLHPERAHDFDAQASRVAVDVLERRRARGKTHENLAIVAAGRGGHPAFEEVFLRVARAHWSRVTVVVPFTASGYVTRLALKSDEVLMHPYAGLGAFDDGNVARTVDAIDADLLDELRDVPEGTPHAAVLARTLAWRRFARSSMEAIELEDAARESLSHARLGREVALDTRALAKVGVAAKVLDGRACELVWELYQSCEDSLGLSDRPEPRYVESGIADEVEFAAAVGLNAALIETVRDSSRFVVDTGSPHPDTGVYLGRWEMT